MKAARYYGKEDIRIEDVPEPTVQPGQVKIAPAFVGICGTDLHEYLGGPNFCPVNAHPITGDSIPVTLGHEFSGTITELGPGVSGDLRVGQQVYVRPCLDCGNCAACDAGAVNVCHSAGFIGLSGGGGGLSSAVCADPRDVFPLPEGVSLDTGALVEPLSVAWHAVSAGPELTPESVVLVLGGGPIGLAVVLCLKAKGVKTIVVSEVAVSRQEFARSFGATRVVNPLEEDVVKTMRDLSGGRGADVSMDCAGVAASIKTACLAIKAKGTVINVAVWEKEVLFNPNWLTFKESAYKSVLGFTREDTKAVIANLKTGAIKPQLMITAKIKLDDVVERGIKALVVDKDHHVKILVDHSL